MNLKLEFMLADMNAANAACEKLLRASVPDTQIHFLARPEVNLGSLGRASALEKTNLIHEGERGILTGAGLGFFAGTYVLKFPIWLTSSPLWYTQSPWYIILATTTIVGALSVAVGCDLLGVNLFKSAIQHYKSKVDRGGILMIVSVPFHQAKKIRKLI